MGILGTGEILVLVVLTLIVFGPERIPELARYFAKFSKMFKEASRELQNQLDMSDLEHEINKSLREEPKKTIGYEESYDDYAYDAEGGGTYAGSENLDEEHGYPDSSGDTDDSASEEEPKIDQPREAVVVNQDEKTQDAQRYGRETLDD